MYSTFLTRLHCFFFYCIAVFFCTSDAGLLARSQCSEGPATGHLDTGFSWFPCVYKQMLRWFPTFHVATTCFSCSPPDLNLVVTNFMFCLHVKCRLGTQFAFLIICLKSDLSVSYSPSKILCAF